jgi:hypothetical protein
VTQRNTPRSTPLYEIIDERDAPRSLSRRRAVRASLGSIVRSIRGAIESGYVAMAGGAMLRVERLEDARAERAFASRHRKAERQRLREGSGG